MVHDIRKVSVKDKAFGIGRAMRIAYRASPLAIWTKLISALISAILPIITVYFAARTTTALASAYAGDTAAGAEAIYFVILTAVLGLLQTVWNSLEDYINARVKYRIDSAISDEMYLHFMSLEFWRYDDKKTIDMFERAKEFARFFSYVFNGISSVLSATVSLFGAVVALALVNWLFALIAAIGAVPGILIRFQLTKMQTRHWNKHVETRRRMWSIENNMLSSSRIAEIRLYGFAKQLLSLKGKLRDADKKRQIEFEGKFLVRRLMASAMEVVAEVISLVMVTLQIIAGSQPVGQFVYVQQMVARALGAAEAALSALSTIDGDIANLFDYNEFMSLKSASERPVNKVKQPDIIEFKNVSFYYPQNDTRVLDEISFTVGKDERVAIVGENGAGKSTIVKLLLGLYEPSSGRVMVDGVDLGDIELTNWHSLIGVLQQDYGIYDFATVRENIEYGDITVESSSAKVATALEAAEAKNFVDKLPKQTDNLIGQWMEHDDGTQGAELSGGQKQRISLARSFYRDSPIAILDEPTSAIDALAEARIFKRLFAKKDKTIITVSHRLSTVKRADKILVIEDGKIVEQGTHQELVDKKGAYYRLFESQL